MSGDLTASFTLRYNDQASAAAQRSLRTIRQEMRGTADDSTRAGRAAADVAGKLQHLGGIRMGNSVTDWLRQVEQYGGRALRQMNLMERAMSATGKAAAVASKGLQNYATAAASYQAAKYVVSGPMGETMSYDRQLANLSNTAYAGQSMADRRSGKKALDLAIMDAVRTGGGSREGAMATLDKLVASGAYTDNAEAFDRLKVLTKGSTAANADPTQLADIAIRAKQTFGLNDTSLVLDQAMAAGKMGGFELKDMARWLPQQMAMARQSGLYGDSGFRTLLAANQASAITAGSKDEAGNNLVNLLAKINSQDTANDAKKLGIDLSGSLAAARGKGVNSLDAFVNLADQIARKDKRFTDLQGKAATETGAERQATYSAMADILQGSAIGKLVQDRQALMALTGIMGNRKYVNKVYNGTDADIAKGTAQSDFDGIAETPSYKAEMAAAEKANAMQQALDKVNPLLGAAADGFSAMAKEFPVATAAVTGLALAATAAAAALATNAGLGALLGRGKGAAEAAKKAAELGSRGPWSGLMPQAAGAGANTASAASRLAPLGAVAAGAAPLGVIAYVADKADPMKADNPESAAGLLGLSKWLASLLPDSTKAARDRYEAQRAELNPQPVRVESVLVLDGQVLAKAVNEVNGREGKRN